MDNSSQSSVAAAAFSSTSMSEVSGNASIADQMTAPIAAGGGWTIGFDQEDLSVNPNAQKTLSSALEASGSFNVPSATSIAQAFANAGTSSSVTLTGITTRGRVCMSDSVTGKT